VTFDVATPEAVAQATAAVAAVDAAGYPAVTAALLRAAALMREGFRADARRELLQTIAANPEEPTLHVLLADVYSKTRLDNLAAAEGSARWICPALDEPGSDESVTIRQRGDRMTPPITVYTNVG
jgi:hypothetical protein